jgi:hypothetical protein
MATLEDQINLAGEGWFRRRVRMASLTAAVAVQGESTENMSPAKYQKRQDLAHRVITTAGVGTPDDDLLRMFTWVCANATNADTYVATETVPDGDIQFTMNSVWDDCAGVTGSD